MHVARLASKGLGQLLDDVGQVGALAVVMRDLFANNDVLDLDPELSEGAGLQANELEVAENALRAEGLQIIGQDVYKVSIVVPSLAEVEVVLAIADIGRRTSPTGIVGHGIRNGTQWS